MSVFPVGKTSEAIGTLTAEVKTGFCVSAMTKVEEAELQVDVTQPAELQEFISLNEK